MEVLQAFGDILYKILYYIQLLVLIRVIASYFIRDFSNPIYRVLYSITEPFLSPFRAILPKSSMGLDFSPIICYLFIEILRSIVIAF